MAAGNAGLIAALFLIAGLLAKLSAAPFQWWAPDAYAGAPTASVAFVSSVPKIAGSRRVRPRRAVRRAAGARDVGAAGRRRRSPRSSSATSRRTRKTT